MPAIVCLSHLRWDFVFQRPQHLLTRAARERQVVFFEEPVIGGREGLDRSERDGVIVATPHVREGARVDDVLRRQLRELLDRERIGEHIAWYYTPAALSFTDDLTSELVVYDCMDELSAFRFARPELPALEGRLLERADLVFTGGQALFEAKRERHPSVHCFPSSVDAAHFAAARTRGIEPADQRGIARPRVGFFGVIDERIDLDLIAGLADARPDLAFVLIGPIAKIDPASLPARENVHYLGPRPYAALPAYLGGWDVAWMPFARNEATRYISPTKILEYMAAGAPIVSTSIRDVVRPYGERALAAIADDVPATSRAIDAALSSDAGARRSAFDAFLATTSWDRTWAGMDELVRSRLVARRGAAA